MDKGHYCQQTHDIKCTQQKPPTTPSTGCWFSSLQESEFKSCPGLCDHKYESKAKKDKTHQRHKTYIKEPHILIH